MSRLRWDRAAAGERMQRYGSEKLPTQDCVLTPDGKPVSGSEAGRPPPSPRRPAVSLVKWTEEERRVATSDPRREAMEQKAREERQARLARQRTKAGTAVAKARKAALKALSTGRP